MSKRRVNETVAKYLAKSGLDMILEDCNIPPEERFEIVSSIEAENGTEDRSYSGCGPMAEAVREYMCDYADLLRAYLEGMPK